MRVLVTGHLGYLGVEMTPVLRQLGHEVVGLDTNYFAGCDFSTPPEWLPALDIDLRDITPAHLVGFDAVVHLAALSNDPLSDLNPGLTYDINLHASVRLAEAAKAAGVNRFVYSSSCSLYGKGGDEEVDEQACLAPVTAYGATKAAVEQQVSRLADRDFSPVFLRNATVYGLSRRLRADVVVNNLVGYAATSGTLILQSDGTPWRPLVHVLDVAQAFARALDAPTGAIHNQAFNVGRVGENYQIREVADTVAEVADGCVVQYGVGATADTRDYRVDFGKIESELPGYQPQWTLRQGIAQLWAAFSDGGLSRDAFEAPTFFRLRSIRQRLRDGELDSDLRWVRSKRDTRTSERQSA
ncbi:SDR family oxidoreductase [Mycobacterium sp. PS03-16]|uniref:NAD-dependent epimerase/dehydratase family protein n=1 Tax=Mycobacterium sp. PS03-16 TaxID=2559611 RepID=UPI001074619E|nr:SDR family oxidoreductase [Mycobacterium sp. PS03-16]TFV59931.1 SDR family oxidoreductase [Mycobacterium sp. PS03-16]